MKNGVLVFASVLIISLAGCSMSKPYDVEAAIRQGEIVDLHGQVSNAQRRSDIL